MSKDEELKVRYYNLIEEEERIQRSANELAIKNARKEGIKEGIEKGMEKGLQEGMEKGIRENKKMVVLNMVKDNLSIDIIARYTNLTVKEVEDIIKNANNQEN